MRLAFQPFRTYLAFDLGFDTFDRQLRLSGDVRIESKHHLRIAAGSRPAPPLLQSSAKGKPHASFNNYFNLFCFNLSGDAALAGRTRR